jgi:hypothetical protein
MRNVSSIYVARLGSHRLVGGTVQVMGLRLPKMCCIMQYVKRFQRLSTVSEWVHTYYAGEHKGKPRLDLDTPLKG